VTTADYKPGLGAISVYELPGGTLVSRHATVIQDFTGLVYSGRVLIAADSSGLDSQLFRCPDGTAMELAVRSRYVAGIAARRRGFVTANAGGGLIFHDGNGRIFRTNQLCYRSTGPTLKPPPITVATHRASGRIAVAFDDWDHFVLDARSARDARVIAHWGGGGGEGMCFHGPNHVITINRGQVRRWPIEAPARTTFPRQDTLGVPGAHHPILVAARDEVCVLDGSQTVRCFNADTLDPVSEKRELTGRTGTVLFSSPDNTGHALGGDGFVYVVTGQCMALQALIDRPQALWRPADLAFAGRTAHIAEDCLGVRPLWDLLFALLEHRFAGEVRLGRSTSPIGDDDISIS
jgi:hypothetical protein